MKDSVEQPQGGGRAAFWLSAGAFLCAVPLVLFGGSVTTIGAGMAVEGWLIAEGYFLLVFPIESWFRDTATFVEHTHRLFAVAVGLFAVAACVASFASRQSRAARWTSVGALLAVVGQGTIGGFRVLENAQHLAFLHGALAQAVFAMLAVSALLHSRAWQAGPRVTGDVGVGAVRWLAAFATIAVYVQIVLGAWYRHALRPSATPDAAGRFLLHAMTAALVLVIFAALHQALASSETLRRPRRRLLGLLLLQIGLGLLSWLGYRPGSVGPLEWTLSILHVLGGGLLLTQALCLWLWIERLRERSRVPSSARSVQPAGGEA